MISFVIPAHNEQAGIGRTLQAIHDSAHAVGQPYEIIVVDDASTDATAEIARQHNATVVSVNHRQIAATRNSGGRAARGARIFFVDADTTINPQAVALALRYMDKGAAGGGGPTLFDGIVPLYIRLFAFVGVLGAKLIGFTGGAFMFCTREAFYATGGFNERLYWAEEGGFALALKREGRFVVLWKPVLTSARRFRTLSGMQVLAFIARLVFSPFKTFTERAAVKKIWYDSNREHDDTAPASLAVKLSNGIALVLLVVLLTEPAWGFTPWSLTPLSSPLGKIRLGVGSVLCHVGLFFWPLGLVLLVNVLRQKRWTGLLQSAGLITFFWWQAWGATHGVIRVWMLFGHWLARLVNG